jgi:hypothetical protein
LLPHYVWKNVETGGEYDEVFEIPYWTPKEKGEGFDETFKIYISTVFTSIFCAHASRVRW